MAKKSTLTIKARIIRPIHGWEAGQEVTILWYRANLPCVVSVGDGKQYKVLQDNLELIKK